MIEFYDASGELVGVVAAQEGNLRSSSTVKSVALSWLRAGGSVAAFEDAYDNWTNGYATGVYAPTNAAIVSALSVVQRPEVSNG